MSEFTFIEASPGEQKTQPREEPAPLPAQEGQGLRVRMVGPELETARGSLPIFVSTCMSARAHLHTQQCLGRALPGGALSCVGCSSLCTWQTLFRCLCELIGHM